MLAIHCFIPRCHPWVASWSNWREADDSLVLPAAKARLWGPDQQQSVQCAVVFKRKVLNYNVQCAKVFERKVLSYNAALCLHYTVCRHVVDRIQDHAFSFYIAYFTRHFLKNKEILWNHCYSPPPVFSSRKSESPSIGSSRGHSQHSQIFLLLFDHSFSRSLVASPLFVLLISASLLGLQVKYVDNVSTLRDRTIFNIQF